jgi:hypothetical protein
MVGGLHKQARLRAAFLTLAFLALLVKVAVPAGFMVAAPGSGSGFPLVICTGHGEIVKTLPDGKGGDSKSKSDAPCAFAGHAAPPTPAVGPEIASATFAHAVEPTAIRFDLVPGRGLAAPPPPSQGPPTLLV